MEREAIIQSIHALWLKSNKRKQVFKNAEERIVAAGAHYQMFMDALGILPDDNSRDTAYRVAKMYVTERCCALYEKRPELTKFRNEKKYDEYVVVKDIPYTSVCSHHHVPFFGTVGIAYLPDRVILGVSKFARLVNFFASKPQIQEEMTKEIIDSIVSELKPYACMVIIKGQHLCMSSRGVKATGSSMVTSAIYGNVDKQEVMELLK